MRRHNAHHLSPLDSLGHSPLTSHRELGLGTSLYAAHFGDKMRQKGRVHAFVDWVDTELVEYIVVTRLTCW